MAIVGVEPAATRTSFARPIKSEAYGALAPRQVRIVDLVTGMANVAGTCRPAAPCRPIEHQGFKVAATMLAELRAMAIAVETEGLFDIECLARRQRQVDAEADELTRNA